MSIDAGQGKATAPLADNPERSMGFALAAGCIILAALDLRPGLVSVGPLLPTIRTTFGLSHTGAALLTSIPDLLLGLLALPTPGLARRFGRDRMIMAALLLVGVSTALRALAFNTAVLFLTTAGVGAGIAIAGTLIGSFIKGAFPHRAALMMGIYAAALSGGSTLAAGATGPIAHLAGGWRLGAGIWSTLALSAVSAWAIVARRARPNSGPPPVKHSLPWTNRTAWQIAAYFGGLNFLFYAMISWLAPMFVEFGLSQLQAGLVLASFTLAFLVANPVFGMLSRGLDRRAWLAVAAGVALFGLTGIAVGPRLAPFLFVPVAAFGMGGAFTLGMTLPLDNTASAEEATSWNAFVMLVGYLIAAAGPLLVGAIRDWTGGFRDALFILVAVAAAMLSLTPLLLPHTHKQARRRARSGQKA